jgi:hypothetical protein
MKKVGVIGIQILTPFMRFLTTFLNFSKLISSVKAQVCNILKNYIDIQQFLLTTQILKLYHSQMVFTQISYLHKQAIQDQNKGFTNCAEFTLH